MTGSLDKLRGLLPPAKRTVLLGVGSRLCQDDYAGMAVIQGLARFEDGKSLLLAQGGSAPENCSGLIRRFAPDVVIVIDAARMGRAPGEYGLLVPSEIVGATFATHMLPLPVTLSYLEQSCGCETAYLGIEPVSTEQGIGLSPAMKAGVARLIGELSRMLQNT